MRLNDLLSGLIVLALGVAVVLHAQSFPAAPRNEIGPALFPQLLGLGLACGGLALIRAGWRERAEGWVKCDEWVRRPRLIARLVAVVGALIAYALLVDTVGFFATAFVFLVVLLLAFGAPRRWIAPLAIATTLLLHFLFYTLLRVPLPWGWFESFAW